MEILNSGLHYSLCAILCNIDYSESEIHFHGDKLLQIPEFFSPYNTLHRKNDSNRLRGCYNQSELKDK